MPRRKFVKGGIFRAPVTSSIVGGAVVAHQGDGENRHGRRSASCFLLNQNVLKCQAWRAAGTR